MKQSTKIILSCVLIAAVITAGYINFKINNEGAFDQAEAEIVAEGEMAETLSDEQTSAVFFSEYKTERENTRAQDIEYLDSIINSGEVSEEVLAEAMSQKVAITTAMETEITIEGLLKGCGYSDAVVTCGDETVNVVVAEKTLSDEQAMQILEIVKSESGKTAQNIKIIPQG